MRFGGGCNIVSTAGTCIRGAEFDPGFVMDFEERGDHSGKPFLGCESPLQFVDAIIVFNNWDEGKRETAADKVLPADRVLVGV